VSARRVNLPLKCPRNSAFCRIDADLLPTEIQSGQAGDTNLGYETFLNGTLVSNIAIDTSQVAADTIDYVATDNNDLTSTSTRTVITEATASSSAQ
jgi:hypothetical protein